METGQNPWYVWGERPRATNSQWQMVSPEGMVLCFMRVNTNLARIFPQVWAHDQSCCQLEEQFNKKGQLEWVTMRMKPSIVCVSWDGFGRRLTYGSGDTHVLFPHIELYWARDASPSLYSCCISNYLLEVKNTLHTSDNNNWDGSRGVWQETMVSTCLYPKHLVTLRCHQTWRAGEWTI